MSLEQDHILCLLSSICPFISALIPVLMGQTYRGRSDKALSTRSATGLFGKEFKVHFSNSLCFIHSISVWTWIPFSQSFKCVPKFSSNSIFTLQNYTHALAAASWQSTSVNWRPVCIHCILSPGNFLSSRCFTACILPSRKKKDPATVPQRCCSHFWTPLHLQWPSASVYHEWHFSTPSRCLLPYSFIPA